MLYKAENENFTLAVKEMGAELNSLKSKKTDIEYIRVHARAIIGTGDI